MNHNRIIFQLVGGEGSSNLIHDGYGYFDLIKGFLYSSSERSLTVRLVSSLVNVKLHSDPFPTGECYLTLDWSGAENRRKCKYPFQIR